MTTTTTTKTPDNGIIALPPGYTTVALAYHKDGDGAVLARRDSDGEMVCWYFNPRNGPYGGTLGGHYMGGAVPSFKARAASIGEYEALLQMDRDSGVRVD